MLRKRILFCGVPQVLACDGNCAKAWGINGRPKRKLSRDPDDYVWLGDDELPTAPPPGKTRILAEGDQPKPSAARLAYPEFMNKWCARECERSVMMGLREVPQLPDMVHPEPNVPRKAGGS